MRARVFSYGPKITPFSIFPLTTRRPLLLRHIHFRHDLLPSKTFEHLPSNEFDYDVFEGKNVVGRIYSRTISPVPNGFGVSSALVFEIGTSPADQRKRFQMPRSHLRRRGSMPESRSIFYNFYEQGRRHELATTLMSKRRTL